MDIRILEAGDATVLANVADDVFDEALGASLVEEFLRDPRHHLAVAIDRQQVVGFASGVHYLHPDSPLHRHASVPSHQPATVPSHRQSRLSSRFAGPPGPH